MVSIPFSKAADQEQQAAPESATLINLNYGFFQCPDAVLKAKGLTFRAKCIYERLLCYARESEQCFPGHTRLALDLGKSVDTIQRGLRELKDYGLITWRRRGLTKTNVYTIVKLSDVAGLNHEQPLKPQKCRIKKPQESGNQTPHQCGTNHIESNHTQVETHEAPSNSKEEGMVDLVVTQCHIAGTTIRSTAGETEEKIRGSNQHTCTTQPTNPQPHTDSARSKTEAPPVRETARERQSLKKNAEVIGRERSTTRTSGPRQTRPEPPRMPAPPLTQDDLDARIRARIAQERARQPNPLADIIPPEHQDTLNRQFGEGAHTTGCRSKRQPVYEKLQVAIERISDELGDFIHVTSNITQAENLRRAANLDIDQFLIMLYEARTATKYALAQGRITKRDATGKLLKTPYFFAVLKDKAGIAKGPGKN